MHHDPDAGGGSAVLTKRPWAELHQSRGAARVAARRAGAWIAASSGRKTTVKTSRIREPPPPTSRCR